MNGTATHYLSKEEVSEKLQGISYSFQESYWESFMESQGSGSSKSVGPQTPSIKLTPKLIAIPASILALSAIIYFSVHNLKSESSSKDPGKNTQEATMLTDSQPKENKIVSPQTNTVKAPIKPTPSSDQKEVTPAVVVSNVPKQEVLVTKDVAKTQKKEDTSTTSTQASKTIKEEKNKVAEQTNVVSEEKKEPTPKKKRRTREKKSEDNVLVPNPEEDNVVIPEN